MDLKRIFKINCIILSVVIFLIACKKKTYAPNDGMIILKYMNNKTDSITYVKDSLTFLQWKTTLQLKPGDTAIIDIDGFKE